MRESAVVLDELAGLLEENRIVLVDVGARGGISSRWRPLEPWLRVIGFEPDARSFEAIDQSERMTVFPTALAARSGNIELHLTTEAGDSSTLAPNRPFLDRFPHAERFDVIETRTIAARTLDEQLDEGGIDRVDFIKLDTQGSELMILEGSAETLRRGVFGIEVEVELNPMYERQPLLADVDRFLRPLGYELFDLEPRRWKYRGGEELALGRGQIAWADAFYFLGPDRALSFLAEGGSVNAESLARVVVTCLLYDLGDYALALVGAVSGDIDPPLRDRLIRAVHTYDAAAKSGRHTLATRVSTGDLRRVHELSQATGAKAAKQLRAALRAWLETRGT